jgi:hypothetical protein
MGDIEDGKERKDHEHMARCGGTDKVRFVSNTTGDSSGTGEMRAFLNFVI